MLRKNEIILNSYQKICIIYDFDKKLILGLFNNYFILQFKVFQLYNFC
jgi:hypothetical protein